MSEDIEGLPERFRSRVRARDRKTRGPKVVMDNPGLRKGVLERARREQERRRAQGPQGGAPPPRPSGAAPPPPKRPPAG